MSQVFMRDLYPNWGAVTTHDATTPEADEQKVLTNLSPDEVKQGSVDRQSVVSFWAVIAAIVAVIVLSQWRS